MRILFWTELFWPYIGGAEVFAAKLLLALRERGHEFIVVTRQDDPSLPETSSFNGIPVYRFPFYATLLAGNIDQLIKIRRQVIELKRAFAPVLAHINSFGPSVLFHLGTANAHPAPLLFTLHGDQYPPPVGRDTLLEQALRAADWVTVPSVATVEYTRHLVPGFVPRVSVIYNGVEVPSLRPEPLPIAAPRLLCLGRLFAEKGVDLLLTALASIVDRCPQARLVIAGDGPERSALEQQAAELGLGHRVEFTGWIAPAAVPALINTATLVVMPSRREALPLVALEAASMARPVVATRVGGLPEVVAHEQTGLLVAPEDSDALAEAIAFLLEHPETARRMGQAARRRAEEVFSWTRCVDAYETLYRRLTGITATENTGDTSMAEMNT